MRISSWDIVQMGLISSSQKVSSIGFVKQRRIYPNKEFFFIIDEINRGNMSKIFGECLMLIEKAYRGTKATLAYSGMPFSVPENLYIIGMMNTADRSLAMIDYATQKTVQFL